MNKPFVKTFTQPFFIQVALGVLMFGSIFSGYGLSDIFSPTSNFFFQSAYHVKSDVNLNFFFFENEFIMAQAKLAPLFCNIVAFLLGFVYLFHAHKSLTPSYGEILLALTGGDISLKKFRNARYKHLEYLCFLIFEDFNFRLGLVVRLFQNNFYFNEVYNFLAFSSLSYFYTHIFLNLDKGFLELAGPRGLSELYLKTAKFCGRFYKYSLGRHLAFVYNTLVGALLLLTVFSG